MLSKSQKIQLILDVKNGVISKNIIKLVTEDRITVLTSKEQYCKDYDIPINEFDSIHAYMKKLGHVHVVTPAED